MAYLAGAGAEIHYRCSCGRILGLSDKSGNCSRCGTPFITPISLTPETYFISDICPFCANPISPLQEPIKCGHCSVVHHRTCWDTNEGCTTWECPGSIDVGMGLLISSKTHTESQEEQSPAVERAPSAPETKSDSPLIPPLPPKTASKESGGKLSSLFGNAAKTLKPAVLKCTACRREIDKSTEKGGCPSCRSPYHISCWISRNNCKKCGYPDSVRKRRERPKISAGSRVPAALSSSSKGDVKTATARIPVKKSATSVDTRLYLQIGAGVAGAVLLILLIILASGGGGGSVPGGVAQNRGAVSGDFTTVENMAHTAINQAMSFVRQGNFSAAETKIQEARTQLQNLRSLAGSNGDFQRRVSAVQTRIDDVAHDILLEKRRRG